MKIIFATTVIPLTPSTGGEIVSTLFINSLKSFSERLTIFGYLRPGGAGRPKNISNTIVPVATRNIESEASLLSSVWWGFCSILKSSPFSVVKFAGRKYLHALLDFIRLEGADVLFIDHTQMLWVVKAINAQYPHLKIVLISHNVESELYDGQAKAANAWIKKIIFRRESLLIRNLERSCVDMIDEVWCLTDHDAGFYNGLANSHKSRIFEMPSLWEVRNDLPVSRDYEVALLGTWSWNSNMDGLMWFLQKVLPLLPESVSVVVAGKGAEKIKSAYPNVKFLGYVYSPIDFVCSTKVFAIPSTIGGGIQIKTLDAIATGVKIVATPTALRGIPSPPGSVYIADSAESFARALISQVYANDSLRFSGASRDWSTRRKAKFLADIKSAIYELKNLGTANG